MTDNQIVKEEFLVYINDLLSTGYIADLFTPEDKEAFSNAMRNECKAAGARVHISRLCPPAEAGQPVPLLGPAHKQGAPVQLLDITATWLACTVTERMSASKSASLSSH